MNAANIVFAAVAVISVVMLFVLLTQPIPAPRENKTTVVVNRSWPWFGPGGTERPRSHLIGPGGTEWPRHGYSDGRDGRGSGHHAGHHA